MWPKKVRPPKSRRRGDAEKNRVREWVSSMVDVRVRWLAFCLFLDPAGVNKGLLEIAGVLGVSPAWVGEKNRGASGGKVFVGAG